MSSAELEGLKRGIDLAALVSRSGVKLEKRGADFFGLCPFHDDREPSLVVSPEKNLWHCLGACQAGGSTIDWVMRFERVSFRHAVEILRAELGASPAAEVLPAPALSLFVDLEDDEALLAGLVGFYHETLKGSAEGLAYLESRGLKSDELISTFKLGFANRTLAYQLPSKKLKAGAALRARLQALGIMRESGHEHFNGSLIVPIFDAAGNVAEIYGRKVTPNLTKGTPLHLYLPGPHAGVFNLEALRSAKEVIVCEALIDALTFWAHGFKNVTSTFGVGGIPEELVEACQAYAVERVLIAFDRDEAGDAGAEKLALRLAALGIACFRVLFPRGMDVNEYALKVSPAAKSLDLVLRQARPMGGEVAARPALPAAPVAVRPLAAPPGESTVLVSEETETSSPKALVNSSPEPPAPAAPKLDIPTEISEQEIVITLGDRRYRIRGLARNSSYDSLKVKLFVGRRDAFFVDSLDLHSAKQRAVFIRQAVEELGLPEDVVKKDVGKVLLKLEELQDAQIKKALEPKIPEVKLSEVERSAALELLKDPRLLERIVDDLESCGVVGEQTNKLVGFLSTVSRKLAKPLAVVVQSSSSAGKSVLMEAILSLLPEEERVQYSAMTGQSLFYMGGINLAHKVLAVAEEEGAERASYALKLLQSEGVLTIASTGKDPQSGKLVTHEYRVEGPVAIFLTSTAIDIDEELLNRCLVLSVEETREQTRAIHRLQRERRTLEGLKQAKRKDHVMALHRNAQRLLRALEVVNPYAPELTFLDTQIRTRRDHEKYLTLIDTLALLHQHQREVKEDEVEGRKIEYVEVEISDIEVANRLAHEVLGRSLDELPPQTRRLLGLLDQLVGQACGQLEMDRSDYRFTRREVREFTGWGDTQLRLHLDRLVTLEYVLVHQGNRGRHFIYELVYEEPKEGGRAWYLPGLIDIEALKESGATMKTSRGSGQGSRGLRGQVAGPLRAQRGPIAGGSRVVENPEKPVQARASAAPVALAPKNHSSPALETLRPTAESSAVAEA